ncbi:MAG: alkaline phosphatase family protein [Gorillibacterium sp.]|nr:alkaline phosphatase family protein [Gorillibacterium sp.]
MQLSKTIVIVLDGLRYDVMVSSMGYLNHLVEKERAAFYKVESELPSLSRPLYEVLLTGTPCFVNGITSNQVVRLSRQQSVFHLASKAGLKTAAAAYYWVSELYQKAPFDYFADRIQHDETYPIQHGMFYFEDSYPDSHLLADGEYLRRVYDPDFLYIHPMNIDDTGHKFTADSAAYRGQALKMDSMLALLIPQWIEEGYHILVTSDHGMNEDGQHGGTGEGERNVGLLAIGSRFTPGRYTDESLPQLALASLMCNLLDISPSADMANIPVPGYTGLRNLP